MKRIVFVLSILSLLMGVDAQAKTKVIRIGNQEQFDQLNKTIHECVADGISSITIRVSTGCYYFKERHLDLSDIIAPGLTLKMIGKKAVLIPFGKEVSTEETIKGYNYSSSVVDIKSGASVNMWSGLKYADSEVEIIDTAQKVCRLKSSGIKSRTKEECKDAYIMITAWCRTYYYHITKIEDSYIYFIADNFEISRVNKNGYNVNDDTYYSKGKVPTRFRLSNLDPLKKGQLHVCETQSFLHNNGGQIKKLSVTGFTFLGNKTNGDLVGWPYSLIVLNAVNAESIRIHRCRFIGQNSRVISINKTNNVQIDNNYFVHNFRNGITSYNSSNCTTVNDNVFEYNGESLSYERCVTCQGSDYHVYNNTFTNFGYCAISVGFYYGTEPENTPSGIVELNTLKYTDDWMNNLWQHSIMDGGAIYLWTRNDVAVVRNNAIINYGGVCFNNGIYCDDGAKGMEIYGNVVCGIENGYSIHSRRVPNVDAQVGGANMNNKVYDNFIDGGFLFVGHEGANNCVKGRNFIVVKQDGTRQDCSVKSIANPVSDEYVEIIELSDFKLLLDRNYLKRVKKSNLKPIVKKYFGTKR